MSKRNGLKKAKRELDILKLPDEERFAYERYKDDLHYQASMVESSYTIGVMEGKEIGEKRGLIKGEKKGINKVALNLISVGRLDIDEISGATGLSVEEIKQLKAEMKIES